MARKLPPEFEVEITDLSRIGEGVGKFGNRKVFVFGALLGEQVLVRPLKKKRRGVKAAVVKILQASPERRAAQEDHFLSCSPWQIVDEATQQRWKLDLVRKMFLNEVGRLPTTESEIVASPQVWHYRNKMEFSFTTDPDDQPVLAFHQRFRYWDYAPLTNCALAQAKINELAQKIMAVIRQRQIPASELKNLLFRYSSHEDKCLAVLYVVNPAFATFDFTDEDLVGWQIVYSDPRSPSTIATERLLTTGRDYLEEKVLDLKLKFYVDGFFQVNVGAFEDLLRFVIGATRPGQVLSDLYSGVGTVGFALAHLFDQVNSIEFDERAVAAARSNANDNNLSNIVFLAGAAEKQDLEACLATTDTLVVDPPRSGLHPKVIKKILKVKPKHFIYISCNPHTQAQNFRELRQAYKAQAWRLFDLYPQTPHIESVLILKRKNFWERFFTK